MYVVQYLFWENFLEIFIEMGRKLERNLSTEGWLFSAPFTTHLPNRAFAIKRNIWKQTGAKREAIWMKFRAITEAKSTRYKQFNEILHCLQKKLSKVSRTKRQENTYFIRSNWPNKRHSWTSNRLNWDDVSNWWEV